MTIQLIVGLGNPGPQYALTRHNVGYWFIESLNEQCRGNFTPEAKFKSLVSLITIHGQPCRLLQPITYMNLSGEAVLGISHFFKIPPEDILVVHDDLDLPVGIARLKWEGGHGGHNGLRDIIARLGTKQFYRLRLGIGHPGDKELVHDYVLQRPSLSDKGKILTAIENAFFVLPDIMQGKMEKAMNILNAHKV